MSKNKILKCSECGEEDIGCEYCDKSFEKGESILCFENEKHYCEMGCLKDDILAIEGTAEEVEEE